MKEKINILVTGAAGFIGSKVCEFFLKTPGIVPQIGDKIIKPSDDFVIIGIDNLNEYYDVRLKQWRLDQLKKYKNFHFYQIDIEDNIALRKLFDKYDDSPSHRQSNSPFHAIINLAARAGVRYSMENPFIYYRTNVIGNLNLLELCREFNVKKYVMASTSSLYAGQKLPFKEDLPVNEPISPYAASKKGAEATCFTYHYLYKTDITIMRFFTVYGPAGRPDMSIFRFILWLDRGVPVEIYGNGLQSRDFTYVDDIVRGTILALKPVSFKIINLGGNEPHKLLDVLQLIENYLNKKANIKYKAFHPADIMETWADISRAKSILGWQPQVKINEGIESTIKWFVDNHSWAAKIQL